MWMHTFYNFCKLQIIYKIKIRLQNMKNEIFNKLYIFNIKIVTASNNHQIDRIDIKNCDNGLNSFFFIN